MPENGSKRGTGPSVARGVVGGARWRLVTWALDLDGVVWLAETPISGSVEAVARLRAHGERVVFLTNNSAPTAGDYAAKLDSMGIPTDVADILTSAQAAARLLSPGD